MSEKIKIRPVIKPVNKKKLDNWSPTNPDSKEMVAISFDVGIINLAYCIMKYNNTTDNFEIFDWDIIKLVDGNPKLMCSQNTQKGKKCTKKAYYLHENKGYCKLHGCTFYDRNITVENVTEKELKTVLFKHFDSNNIFLKVDFVLIENQPLKAREKIKGIGHAIFDYYILRGLDHNLEYTEIKFIDAKNKLTVYEGPPLTCSLKTQYARNKWYSIKYCDWIIKNNEGLHRYFDTYGKKKDDLADCFLQGLWYLKYSRVGKKPPVSSSHQKLVYRENNRLQFKKIRACKPSQKSINKGKYTLSNIKYLTSKKSNNFKDPILESSINFFFGDMEYFCGVLKNM